MAVLTLQSKGAGTIKIGNTVINGTVQNLLKVDASGNLGQLAPGSNGNVVYVTGGVFTSDTPENAGLVEQSAMALIYLGL